MDKSKVKILVVDDEQGLCAGVQEALRREGYVVDAMTDAPAAAKLAERRLYNLIVSDIKMPGLSGLELLTQVRAHSRDTLFILMTAFGTVESAVEAMKQGADELAVLHGVMTDKAIRLLDALGHAGDALPPA